MISNNKVSRWFLDALLNKTFVIDALGLGLVYLGLCTTMTSSNGEKFLMEISAKDHLAYARQSIECSLEGFTYASNGVIYNAKPITFARADRNWGKITHIAIFDEPRSGSMITVAPLKTQINIYFWDRLILDPRSVAIILGDYTPEQPEPTVEKIYQVGR